MLNESSIFLSTAFLFIPFFFDLSVYLCFDNNLYQRSNKNVVTKENKGKITCLGWYSCVGVYIPACLCICLHLYTCVCAYLRTYVRMRIYVRVCIALVMSCRVTASVVDVVLWGKEKEQEQDNSNEDLNTFFRLFISLVVDVDTPGTLLFVSFFNFSFLFFLLIDNYIVYYLFMKYGNTNK